MWLVCLLISVESIEYLHLLLEGNVCVTSHGMEGNVLFAFSVIIANLKGERREEYIWKNEIEEEILNNFQANSAVIFS